MGEGFIKSYFLMSASKIRGHYISLVAFPSIIVAADAPAASISVFSQSSNLHQQSTKCEFIHSFDQ